MPRSVCGRFFPRRGKSAKRRIFIWPNTVVFQTKLLLRRIESLNNGINRNASYQVLWKHLAMPRFQPKAHFMYVRRFSIKNHRCIKIFAIITSDYEIKISCKMNYRLLIFGQKLLKNMLWTTNFGKIRLKEGRFFRTWLWHHKDLVVDALPAGAGKLCCVACEQKQNSAPVVDCNGIFGCLQPEPSMVQH